MAKIVATTKDQRFALHQRKIPDLAIEKSILRTDTDTKRTKSIKFMDISDEKKCNMALYHSKRHPNVSEVFFYKLCDPYLQDLVHHCRGKIFISKICDFPRLNLEI